MKREFCRSTTFLTLITTRIGINVNKTDDENEREKRTNFLFSSRQDDEAQREMMSWPIGLGSCRQRKTEVEGR